MSKTLFTGSGVAIVTPFTKDGSVNIPKLNELIDFQIDNGTDAIIICGTTGESATLSDEEHIQAIRAAVAHTAGRIPVIAGTGSNDTNYCIHLSEEAQELGADGLLLVTPYYNKTTQAGLIRHFTSVADRVSIPIVLYNVPSRTGMNIAPETYLALSKHPNIVAAKEACGDFSRILQTMHLCGGDLDVYSGNDDQIVPILSLGGKGVISVLANIMPRQTHERCSLYAQGKTAESAAMQIELADLIDSLFIEVNPIPVKTAMNLMGFDVGELRMPLAPMAEKNLETLKTSMRRHGLIG